MEQDFKKNTKEIVKKNLEVWVAYVLAKKQWSAQRWAEEAGVDPVTLTRNIPEFVHIPKYDTLAMLALVAGEELPPLIPQAKRKKK